MKNNNTDLIEYGEIARHPITQNTLVKHWIMINSSMKYSTMKIVFYNGCFYELNDYRVTQYGNNKYISEIKLLKCL